MNYFKVVFAAFILVACFVSCASSLDIDSLHHAFGIGHSSSVSTDSVSVNSINHD